MKISALLRAVLLVVVIFTGSTLISRMGVPQDQPQDQPAAAPKAEGDYKLPGARQRVDAGDFATIQAALDQASDSHDVIVTSGGVSVGGEDHVKTAVEALGQLHLWRLAIKPGRPIAFGQVGRVPFVGLPGNPVAVMVTFLRVARPVLLKLAGARSDPSPLFPVRAGFAYEKKAGRREYLRARIEMSPGRAPTAHKFERDGAGVLSSMVAADGLVELAEDITTVAEGDMVDYLPFSEVGL